MDRAKKPIMSMSNKNAKIYMDLKDIIRENALRFLPAKSVFRLSGVCRDWKMFMSTPFFAHNQSISFRGGSGLFCQSPSSPPSFISLDPMAFGVPDPSFKFLPEPVVIKCSSNGLLCCQGLSGYKAYYVCNPATQQWKKLPKPENEHGSDPAIVLIHEPSLLNFSAEYTLICAFESDLDGLEFEIYSSSKGSWRTSGEICFGNRQVVPSSGVYVGGVVYWHSKYSTLLAFDVASERSTLINSHHLTLFVLLYLSTFTIWLFGRIEREALSCFSARFKSSYIRAVKCPYKHNANGEQSPSMENKGNYFKHREY